MDPWIHGSAAGAAAKADAGAAAGAAASAATVCTYYVIIGGCFAPPLYLHDEIHTVAAEAAALAAAPAAAVAAAPAAALAAAPAADPWIHGSISFIMNHIFYLNSIRTARPWGASQFKSNSKPSFQRCVRVTFFRVVFVFVSFLFRFRLVLLSSSFCFPFVSFIFVLVCFSFDT